MKKYLWLPLFCAILVLSGAEAGKPQPKVRAAKWYFKSSVPVGNLECTVLFDIAGTNSKEMLRMLETIQEEFRIPIQAVAINAVDQTDAFAAAAGPFTIGLAADDKLKTRNTLAEHESLFPYAVLSKDGVVVWSGEPTELDSVIEQVKAGRFSQSKQKKVEQLRRELQMAIQSGLPHVVTATADKILAESPSDRIAIQAKIMGLSTSGKQAEIPAFVRKVCEANPQDLRLRVMELDMLLQGSKPAEFLKAVQKFSRDFPKPDARLVRPVAYIVENAPYGLLMPDQVMTLAKRAYDGIKSNPKSLTFAIACETLARAYAEQGRFAEAVKLQKQALPLRLKTPQEAAAKVRLQYFQALQKSSKNK